MKRLIQSTCLMILCGTASAQSSGFGLGLILGAPTGISVKKWTGPTTAVDGAIAWSVGNYGWFQIHADYLFHDMGLIPVAKGKLPLYYGPGLRITSWNGGDHWNRGRWHGDDGGGLGLGARFAVGLDYLPQKAPVDVFLEIAPTLELVPATWLDVDGAIGVRYWFR